MQKRIWIKPDVLTWHSSVMGTSALNESKWQRAHEIWYHASTTLTHNATEMDRVDAITTLKRCLNQRLKQLESIYKIRSFIQENNSRYIQLLERLACGSVILDMGFEDLAKACRKDWQAVHTIPGFVFGHRSVA